MSESNTHRNLVTALMEDISNRMWDSWPFLYADSGCLALPPLIGRARPDVYAHFALQDRAIIGEAKTCRDLESFHTVEQFEAYFEHLSSKASGELWLAVPWETAGTAMRICTATKVRMRCSIPFRVTGWLLGTPNFSRAWHG